MSSSCPEIIFEQLATPCVRLDVARVVRAVNPAASAWLGLSARRFYDRGLESLGFDRRESAAMLALPAGQSLRLARARLAPTPEHERFAEVRMGPLVSAAEPAPGWLLEFWPQAEFDEDGPSARLPLALHAALKGLAHEVKNPLAGIRGAAQLLARRLATDADAKRYLDVISDEARRLDRLLDRLLDPAPPKPLEPVNLHALLERVRMLAEAEAGWAHLIQRDYDVSLPEVPADADRLSQAVWNLLRNALEAGASVVRLRTRAQFGVLIGEQRFRRAVRIEIEDNGRGVPPDLADRVFLPLVSGRAQGSGLGLTLSQQIVREHRGALSYRSRPGHSVFTLLLPIGEALDGEANTESR